MAATMMIGLLSQLTEGAAASRVGYSVAVIDRALGPDNGSIISAVNGTSAFRSNFNAAWLPLAGNAGGGLFIRVTDTNAKSIPSSISLLGKGCTPTSRNSTQSHSRIAFVPAVDEGVGLRFAYVDETRLVVGVAPSLDPRATFRALTNRSYLTYQCNVAHGGKLLRKTFVASTLTPENPSSWRDQPHPMFPGDGQDCGTCVWFPEDGAGRRRRSNAGDSPPPAYALATMGGLRGGNITLMKSTDNLSTWSAVGNGDLLSTRPGHWDDRTLSSAACPKRLSDGNWLVLYNVDNKWPVDAPKPIPAYGRCALGWAILSKHNVSVVLARAEAPLLFASEPYDTSPAGGAPSVYTDGLREDEGTDAFIVYAGGQDQVVEAVRIQVTKKTTIGPGGSLYS